jgi:hypothetical protein
LMCSAVKRESTNPNASSQINHSTT